MLNPKPLESILSNLLMSRVKEADAPCAADQHWCSAIADLYHLTIDYHPDDAEAKRELEYALIHQDILHGKISANDVNQ